MLWSVFQPVTMFFEPDGHSIWKMIQLHFPYNEYKGNYNEFEYRRYSNIGLNLVMPFWLCATLLMLAFMFTITNSLPYLAGTIAVQVFPGAHYLKNISGFTAFYCMACALALGFVIAPLAFLKMRYGYSYNAVVDFLSLYSHIDIKKGLRKFSLPVIGISLILMCYDLTNCTLINDDEIYTKEFYSMPHNTAYKDVQTVLARVTTTANNTDTNYVLQTTNGNVIPLQGCGGREVELINSHLSTQPAK